MIQPDSLDTTRWGDLYARAVAALAARVPGWDDTRASDPGVTLLELAAYLSDVQNHVADTVTDAHYAAYLRLLGGAPNPLRPARLRAAVETAQGRLRLPAGVRVYAGEVPFELESEYTIEGNRIARLSLADMETETPLQLPSPVFTMPGQTLKLHLAAPLQAGGTAVLDCHIEPCALRRPPAPDTPPPVRLRAAVSGLQGQIQAALRDDTCGFLRNGQLYITSPKAGDCIHLTVEGAYTLAPVLRRIALDTAAFVQKRTRARTLLLSPPFALPCGLEHWALRFFMPAAGDAWTECKGITANADGTLTGFGNCVPASLRVVCYEPDFAAVHQLTGITMQRITLEETGILPGSLRAMQQEGALWYDCPVRAAPAAHTPPRGCVYIEDAHALQFGDGRDFAIPAPGELLLTGCAVTLGAAGNGATGPLHGQAFACHTVVPAAGGQDREAVSDAFARVAKKRETPLRAVSCADYEALAMRTPGLALHKVRALPYASLEPGTAGVVLVAKPHAAQPCPALPAWYRQRLCAYLESFRLVGVRLSVRGPHYVPIDLHVRLHAQADVPEQALRQTAQALADGARGPVGFGERLRRAALFAALSALDGVCEIGALEIYPRGAGGVRLPNGDVQLAPDALPYLDAIHVIPW